MYLITQFLLINGHFTLNLLAGLVCFAVGWLYFDAWLGRHDMKEGTKSLGFGLLSLSFVVHSTSIDQNLLQSSILGADTVMWLTMGLRLAGYVVLIVGQLIDPIQPLPSYRKSGAEAIMPLTQMSPLAYPVMAVVTAVLYLHRATVGLENHLKPISWSLFVLAVSELVGLATLFRGATDVGIANLTAPFGPLWLAEHIVLIISMAVLGKWGWGDLVKRLENQMLMFLTNTTLIVF